ncbi:hypothetical protein FISHEDRAFT_70401 [Fistulina hepatica ATCC 64428]|uniref:Uncharacterized protein n=1 Tax=Fistulina hepatica ATCC 64428 TaxID=1128425 RepID=A0A0D7AK03_9AGAR|nr:hypothetical protein FISHEDRAFT_70401 [Fistulina hepatica ATCC 64428]
MADFVREKFAEVASMSSPTTRDEHLASIQSLLFLTIVWTKTFFAVWEPAVPDVHTRNSLHHIIGTLNDVAKALTLSDSQLLKKDYRVRRPSEMWDTTATPIAMPTTPLHQPRHVLHHASSSTSSLNDSPLSLSSSLIVTGLPEVANFVPFPHLTTPSHSTAGSTSSTDQKYRHASHDYPRPSSQITPVLATTSSSQPSTPLRPMLVADRALLAPEHRAPHVMFANFDKSLPMLPTLRDDVEYQHQGSMGFPSSPAGSNTTDLSSPRRKKRLSLTGSSRFSIPSLHLPKRSRSKPPSPDSRRVLAQIGRSISMSVPGGRGQPGTAVVTQLHKNISHDRHATEPVPERLSTLSPSVRPIAVHRHRSLEILHQRIHEGAVERSIEEAATAHPHTPPRSEVSHAISLSPSVGGFSPGQIEARKRRRSFKVSLPSNVKGTLHSIKGAFGRKASESKPRVVTSESMPLSLSHSQSSYGTVSGSMSGSSVGIVSPVEDEVLITKKGEASTDDQDYNGRSVVMGNGDATGSAIRITDSSSTQSDTGHEIPPYQGSSPILHKSPILLSPPAVVLSALEPSK